MTHQTDEEHLTNSTEYFVGAVELAGMMQANVGQKLVKSNISQVFLLSDGLDIQAST
jgi:hypothetical protein